jgi:sulfite oxidase
MRIGNLKVEEGKPIDYSDPYAFDPKRHPSLLVRTQKPFNAEAPKEILSEYITPNDLFYVRNHLPVPNVNPEDYVLEVGGEGLPTVKLTLEDLKKLPAVTVTATIQCAGQRRNELKAVKPGMTSLYFFFWWHFFLGKNCFVKFLRDE